MEHLITMAGMNCWEFKKCGRQPGGAKEKELGTCVAATEKRLDGVNEGKNAGRMCFAVSGTLCWGKVQGSFAVKMSNCMECDFYEEIQKVDGAKMVGAKKILEILNRS